MRIFENGIYRDMTEEENATFNFSDEATEDVAKKDKLTSLAEGLSTATSLAQVRNSAKNILGDALNES